MSPGEIWHYGSGYIIIILLLLEWSLTIYKVNGFIHFTDLSLYDDCCGLSAHLKGKVKDRYWLAYHHYTLLLKFSVLESVDLCHLV